MRTIERSQRLDALVTAASWWILEARLGRAVRDEERVRRRELPVQPGGVEGSAIAEAPAAR
jgi:hypothetical protein